MAGNETLREAATGTRVMNPVTNLASFLEKNKKQIALALPKHLNADRMCRLAMTAFSQNKTLQECDIKTIFASIITAGQMGLEIGVAGQGYLVPYKGKCQFIPGWQGLVDLVARSGRGTVWTGAVFEGDDFEWAMGDKPFINHRPCGEDDIAKLRYVYAIGRMSGAEWAVIEVWPMSKVIKHRDKYNKVGAKHYSYENLEMYARKVALLQVIKYMPKSIELTNALEIDEAAEHGKHATLDGISVRIDDDEAGGDQAAGNANAGAGSAPAAEAGKSETVNKETGEIKKDPEQPGNNAPDINDCIKLIKANNYEEARDLARQIGTTAPKAVEDMIATHEATKKANKKGGMSME